MKPSIVVLYVLVSLCLVFSLTALLFEASDHGFFAPNAPSTTPTKFATPPIGVDTTPSITNALTPSTAPPPTDYSPTPQANTPPSASANTSLTINYDETNREKNGDRITVTLTVTATYQSGEPITINYSQFYLQLYVSRMTFLMPGEKSNYPNNNTGTLDLGPNQTTQTFQLAYEYNKLGFNGMDAAPNFYQLQCHSKATIYWPNQTYY